MNDVRPSDESETRIDCAPNFRELQGIRLGSGSPILAGRIFRSDAIIAPSEEDIRRLEQNNIGLVIDLRSSIERKLAPTGTWTSQKPEVHAVDMLAHIEGSRDPWDSLRHSPDAMGAEQAMLTVYRGFPAALYGQLRMIMLRVLARPGATLIHCTAGKDRTGFLVAMLLAALGTSRSEIFENYLQSRGRGNPAARAATEHLAIARTGVALPDAAVDRLMSVSEAYLMESFEAIDRDFAGLDRYLLSAGVSTADLAALEARLT